MIPRSVTQVGTGAPMHALLITPLHHTVGALPKKCITQLGFTDESCFLALGRLWDELATGSTTQYIQLLQLLTLWSHRLPALVGQSATADIGLPEPLLFYSVYSSSYTKDFAVTNVICNVY